MWKKIRWYKLVRMGWESFSNPWKRRENRLNWQQSKSRWPRSDKSQKEVKKKIFLNQKTWIDRAKKSRKIQHISCINSGWVSDIYLYNFIYYNQVKMGVSWIDILVPVVVTIIIILVSIYLFSMFSHRTQIVTQHRRREWARMPFQSYSSFCSSWCPGVRYCWFQWVWECWKIRIFR